MSEVFWFSMGFSVGGLVILLVLGRHLSAISRLLVDVSRRIGGNDAR